MNNEDRVTQKTIDILTKVKSGPCSGRQLGTSDPEICEILFKLEQQGFVSLTMAESLGMSRYIAGALIEPAGLAFLAEQGC